MQVARRRYAQEFAMSGFRKDRRSQQSTVFE